MSDELDDEIEVCRRDYGCGETPCICSWEAELRRRAHLLAEQPTKPKEQACQE